MKAVIKKIKKILAEIREVTIRIKLIPDLVKGSIVAVRVGEGAGITIYTANHNKSTIQKVSAKLFQFAYNIR